MFIESRALTFQKNSFKNDEKMFFFGPTALAERVL